MKKYIIFILLLHLIALHAMAQRWGRKIIAEKISIEFPSVPVMNDTTEQTSFSSLDKGVIYAVSVTDNINMGFLPESKKAVNDFYKGAAKGMLERYNGTAVRVGDFYIGRLKGAELEFTFNHKSGFTERRFARFLVLNDVTLILQVGTRDNIDSITMQKKNFFFNSLKLKGKDDDWWQYDDNKSNRIASMAGYLIGKWVFILLIGACLFAFIRFLAR